MGLADYVGGLGNLWSTQQAQMRVDSKYANTLYSSGYAYSGTNNTLTVSPAIAIEGSWAASPPRPPTAVEWLDRRVDEMRVKL